jgi:hypothetical protein
VLQENEQNGCTKKFEIPIGTAMNIQEFKTYKSPVSGFTHLFALGDVYLASGEKVTVEYDWGTTDLAQLGNNAPELTLALWQESYEPPVRFYNP